MKKLSILVFLLEMYFVGVAQNCNLPSIHFDNGRTNIKQEFYQDIGYVANFLKENPTQKLLITGFDTKEADLAIRRAEKVMAFLVNNFKISCENVGTKAKVIIIPDGPNKKQLVDYFNRRVEFECIAL